MKQIYKQNNRPYMIKESINDDMDNTDEINDTDDNTVYDFDEPDDADADEEKEKRVDADDYLRHFFTFNYRFDDNEKEILRNKVKEISKTKRIALAKRIKSYMERDEQEKWQREREGKPYKNKDYFDIFYNMIEYYKELDERSFNYDADKENFDELEFDTEEALTLDNEDDANEPVKPSKPVQIAKTKYDEDTNNFIYTLDQELKLSEPNRSHFYIVLKNDQETDYEVVVIGKQTDKQGEIIFIFNIFEPVETVRAIPVSSIDIDKTMIDQDSRW